MITINMDKAKDIAHNIRREKRAEEFKPYDEIIMKQIPGSNTAAAEVARQEIRNKYNSIQQNIDMALTPEGLKTVIDNI